jgi:hypothetical protein
VSDSKPQVVDTIPESYIRSSGLQFIDGVLHQLYLSGHTGGDGVWIAVPGQKAADPEPVAPPAPTPAPAIGTGTDGSAAAPAPSPTPAPAGPVPTEQGMQVQSPAQEG